MRDSNRTCFKVKLPKEKGWRFKTIYSAHNVFPGTMLRYFVERVIEGKLVIPPDVRKKTRLGGEKPIKPAKHKRSASG